MASIGTDAEEQTDEQALLFLLLVRRRRRLAAVRSRHIWERSWIRRREGRGVYGTLLRELDAEDPEMFRRYHRVDRESFRTILAMVSPHIQKVDTNMRVSITPGQRLSATLRFLATGESFVSLSFAYRLGERTLSCIVDETCIALVHAMKNKYLQVPASEDDWRKVADEFESKWNYPGCIGAIDGKHVAVKQPADSGSEFFNYKHFFSVLLVALVDANYKFLYVNVGAAGRDGDAGVFSNSSLKKALDDNSLNVPSPLTLEGTTNKLHHHIVGDDAFPLRVDIMKPYPHRNLDKPKLIFNYRLSRARRVVENAFGILSNRFRVFLTTINLAPDKVTDIILAACCLHNYLVDTNKHTYISVQDTEDSEHNAVAGAWRTDPTLTAELTAHVARTRENRAYAMLKISNTTDNLSPDSRGQLLS
ncbi:hypothetical protein LSAT2_020154 [Lamellibrachia satsuma]|nr:hypothetical protein LSAT2_020154 [Lamellibrachia satsuma]